MHPSKVRKLDIFKKSEKWTNVKTKKGNSFSLLLCEEGKYFLLYRFNQKMHLIVLLIILLFTIVICTSSSRSYFSLNPDSGKTCGDEDDVWACCERNSSGEYIADTPGYEKRFRGCMCHNGYDNYCYPQATNFLLSE